MTGRRASRSRAIARRVETRPQPRPSRAPDSSRQRGGPRWVFPASLGISALLHLIALFLLRFESELLPVFGAGDPVIPNRPVGMVVYDIEPADEAAGATPEEDQRPAPAPPEPEAVPPALIPPAPIAPALPSSDAERINPKMGESSVWDGFATGDAPVHPDHAVRRPITLEEWNAVVNPRLSIAEYNDSVRLAEEAAAKAVDWTVKTGAGGRWGMSPKGIHLGSFTLPVPIQLGRPPGRREGARAVERSWSEIQVQRGAMVIQGDIEDRVKAIRERKEAERRDSTRRGGGRIPRASSP